MVLTSMYSIITIEFPKEKEVYIGYCQAASGIGFLVGPAIGTTLYMLTSYEYLFYIMACLLICSMVCINHDFTKPDK